MTITTTTASPPRPSIPAPELLALAKEHGIASYTIKAITVLPPDGDVLIEEMAGVRYRICTVPDGAGRKGLLLDSNHRIGHLRNFTPRVSSEPNEPWELIDFDWLADKMIVPSPSGAVDSFFGYSNWLLTGEDPISPGPIYVQPWPTPVACYALWRNQAAGRMRGVSMREAVNRSDMCTALRTEVRNSGWLSKRALAELDAR